MGAALPLLRSLHLGGPLRPPGRACWYPHGDARALCPSLQAWLSTCRRSTPFWPARWLST